jgi:hypothetical protein
VREQFLQNYHHWCLDEAVREASSSFASVRAVRGFNAMRSANALLGFPASARKSLALGLVEQWHHKEIDEERRTLVTEFKNSRLSAPPANSIVVATPADRTVVRRLVKQSAPEILGSLIPGSGRVAMQFKRTVGQHEIMTFVDTGGRNRQLEYNQLVWLEGETRPVAEQSINMMSWLGLASVTTWDLLPAGDEEEAVRTMLRFCSRFMDAVPYLVTH